MKLWNIYHEDIPVFLQKAMETPAMQRLLHSAAPNGSWCGDQRQLSAANGTLN